MANKLLFRGSYLPDIIRSFKQEAKEKLKSKLPNILSLSEDGWECSIVLRTVIAMRKQKTCREKIMEELYELYMEVYGKRKEWF